MIAFDPGDLSQERFRAYGLAPIPDERDDAVATFVTALMTCGPDCVTAVVGRVQYSAMSVLQAYAERMSSLAVRTGDGRRLPDCLVAVYVGGLCQGENESLMSLALIDDAATRLQIDLKEVMARATLVLGSGAEEPWTAWLQRSRHDRSIEAMGFVASEDQDGFRYSYVRSLQL